MFKLNIWKNFKENAFWDESQISILKKHAFFRKNFSSVYKKHAFSGNKISYFPGLVGFVRMQLVNINWNRVVMCHICWFDVVISQMTWVVICIQEKHHFSITGNVWLPNYTWLISILIHKFSRKFQLFPSLMNWLI